MYRQFVRIQVFLLLKLKLQLGVNQIEIKKAIYQAIAEATKNGKLRPNSVDSLTGKNSGDNLGGGTPVIKFDQWEKDYIDVRLDFKRRRL